MCVLLLCAMCEMNMGDNVSALFIVWIVCVHTVNVSNVQAVHVWQDASCVCYCRCTCWANCCVYLCELSPWDANGSFVTQLSCICCNSQLQELQICSIMSCGLAASWAVDLQLPELEICSSKRDFLGESWIDLYLFVICRCVGMHI